MDEEIWSAFSLSSKIFELKVYFTQNNALLSETIIMYFLITELLSFQVDFEIPSPLPVRISRSAKGVTSDVLKQRSEVVISSGSVIAAYLIVSCLSHPPHPLQITQSIMTPLTPAPWQPFLSDCYSNACRCLLLLPWQPFLPKVHRWSLKEIFMCVSVCM